MASLNPQPRMKEKFCYHLCALKNRQEIIHFSRVCELLSTTLDLMSQLKKRTDVSILTCSQVAAHSKMGILPTATAMETNLPNNIMRFSSAWLPWRLKSAENMSRRTLSRLCSWKQLHMISRSWSSWRALILCKKGKVVIFHLCYLYLCVFVLMRVKLFPLPCRGCFCLSVHAEWTPPLTPMFWSRPEEAASQTAPCCRCRCPGGTTAPWLHSAHPEATTTDGCPPLALNRQLHKRGQRQINHTVNWLCEFWLFEYPFKYFQ